MVGIVLVTHCNVAESLLDAATNILGNSTNVVAVTFAPNGVRDDYWNALQEAVEKVDEGSGVLVLADMFGGTPSNLAMALLATHQVQVITGLNLPMVLRAMQRAGQHSLQELSEDVIQYGRRNITASAKWLPPKAKQATDAGEA